MGSALDDHFAACVCTVLACEDAAEKVRIRCQAGLGRGTAGHPQKQEVKAAAIAVAQARAGLRESRSIPLHALHTGAAARPRPGVTTEGVAVGEVANVRSAEAVEKQLSAVGCCSTLSSSVGVLVLRAVGVPRSKRGCDAAKRSAAASLSAAAVPAGVLPLRDVHLRALERACT